MTFESYVKKYANSIFGSLKIPFLEKKRTKCLKSQNTKMSKGKEVCF